MSLVEPIVQPACGQSPGQRNRTNKVLLLGNDDRVVLAIIRSLGRRGIRVHVAWCDPNMSALRSRYVSQFHSIPAYSYRSDVWVNALNDLVREQDYDLVIPCNDCAVVPLQVERHKLDTNTRWYLISDEAFDIAFDKTRTSHVARELGISLPAEFSLSDKQIQVLSGESAISEIDDRQLEFPVYVKPRSSITHENVGNKRSVQKIESAADLAEVFRQTHYADGLLIQERFKGEGVGVEILARNGRVVMELQHRRLRETIDGGSTYRETIPRMSELANAAAKLVRHLNYSGVAMFEFRFNPQTKQWVLLEINARFWGSLPLAIAAGANFPYCLYEMLVCGRKEFSGKYKPGVRCRNLVADLRAFKKQRALNGSSKQRFQWANLLLARDHLDHFAVDDWRPQLHSLWQLSKSLIPKLLSGIRR